MRGWVRGNHCVVFVSFAGRACAAVLGAMLKLVVDGVADVFHVLGRNVGCGLRREGSVVVFEQVWEFLSDLAWVASSAGHSKTRIDDVSALSSRC